ncbi:Hpt domain-containing protein, partial [Acinetobacter baumannii]
VVYRRLLGRFRDSYQDFAADFEQAMAAGDDRATIRLAHTLKSVAGTLGATEVQAAAADLEQCCERHAEPAALRRALGQVLGSLGPV